MTTETDLPPSKIKWLRALCSAFPLVSEAHKIELQEAMPAALDRIEALEASHAALWEVAQDFVADMALRVEARDLTHDRVLHWAKKLKDAHEHASEAAP